MVINSAILITIKLFKMSNYNFNGNITGNNNHFGNVYNYRTVEEFVSKNRDLKFTEADIELFRLIFDKVDSEEEKWKIINSLKSIKSGEADDTEKAYSVQLLNKFLKGVKSVANDVTVKIATEKVGDFLSKNNAVDIWNSIKDHIFKT